MRSFFQHENHRSLPVSNEYTLDGLYPNTLYHIWLAAKSRRGEGAATPPIATRTEQYGKSTKQDSHLLIGGQNIKQGS